MRRTQGHETGAASALEVVDATTVKLKLNFMTSKTYHYSKVFGHLVNQFHIFEQTTMPLVKDVFWGKVRNASSRTTQCGATLAAPLATATDARPPAAGRARRAGDSAP